MPSSQIKVSDLEKHLNLLKKVAKKFNFSLEKDVSGNNSTYRSFVVDVDNEDLDVVVYLSRLGKFGLSVKDWAADVMTKTLASTMVFDPSSAESVEVTAHAQFARLVEFLKGNKRNFKPL